jgi:hypothetical protein
MKLLTTTAVLALSAIAASAATTSQLQPVGTNIPGDSSPFNPISGLIGLFNPASPVRVALPKFNSTLGTLTGAIIRVDGAVQARVTVENNDPSAAQGVNVTLDGTLRLFQDAGFNGAYVAGTDTTVTIAAAFGLPSTSVNLAASDGPGNAGAGADFNDFGLLTSGVSPVQTVNVNAGQLFGYIGAPGDQVFVFLTAATPFSVSGVGNSSNNISQAEATANVTIEYIYDVVQQEVPEPSHVLALGGLFALGLGSRRRK